MVNSKKRSLIFNKLLFLFLVIYPFGILLRYNINLFSNQIALQIIDVIVFINFFIYLFFVNKNKYDYLIIIFIIFTFLFSWLFSATNYTKPQNIISLIYLGRLFAYIFLYFTVKLNGYNSKEKLIIKKALILVIFIVSVFGWIQYFILPDFRPLRVLGWDIHLYRLAGAFADPNYLSIVLVLGLIILFGIKGKIQNILFYFISGFLIISILFTYSRSGYLALLTVFLLHLRKPLLLLFFIGFLIVLLFLPKKGGEGINLLRSQSIINRISNYKQTLLIARKNPLFGIGYNNICWEKLKISRSFKEISHSCYGSDSSLLLLISTTGVVGLIIFISGLFNIFQNDGVFKDKTFKTLIGALFINSIFINSLFYPWVISIIMIYAALSRGSIKD